MIAYTSNFRNANEMAENANVFSQCPYCEIYPCESSNGYYACKDNRLATVSSLNSDENIRDCYMRHDLILINCNTDYVSNGIGNAYKINTVQRHDKKGRLYSKIEETSDRQKDDKTIGRWEPTQPVFISAQTGKGKNHFIEETLIPYVRELNHRKGTNHRVLVLSNRIALRLQILERMNADNGLTDFNDASVYSMDEYADVMMYQGFLRKMQHYEMAQKKKMASYLFIICDEAHFFTSDAMFNPYTEKTLSAIVKTFKNAIRIYMSATPYECLGYIQKHERLHSREEYPPFPVLYYFKRDYSYLDIKYYSNFNELVGIMEKGNNENWLVFIDNKKRCAQFKEELDSVPALKGKVYTVSRESKLETKYQKMIATEQIDASSEGKIKTKVLIATSVIDNGVNFRNIHNVVVSDISKVKCLQMLGRARVDQNKRVTLYIKRQEAYQIERRLTSFLKQQDAYHALKMCEASSEDKLKFYSKYYNGDEVDWVNAKHWFGRDLINSAEVFPNEIAKSLVNEMVPIYSKLLHEMQDDEAGQKYLEYQLSWFRQVYDPKDDISLVGKDAERVKLIEFLELHKDQAIPKEQQDVFCAKCTELIDIAFGRKDKNIGRHYKRNKLNSILSEYEVDFLITSSPNGWNVTRQCDS